LELLNSDIKAGEKLFGLAPEEKAELIGITNYLQEQRLRANELELVFNIDTDVSDKLVEE
jgi:hypothetical protein